MLDLLNSSFFNLNFLVEKDRTAFYLILYFNHKFCWLIFFIIFILQLAFLCRFLFYFFEQPLIVNALGPVANVSGAIVPMLERPDRVQPAVSISGLVSSSCKVMQLLWLPWVCNFTLGATAGSYRQ